MSGLERGLEGALDWGWSDAERKGANDDLQASGLETRVDLGTIHRDCYTR